MKRIQMLKVSIVALAIGGAFASKANTRQAITRYTVANTPGLPCQQGSGPCGTSGGICTSGSGPTIRTYYHQNATKLCAVTLQKLP